MGSSPRRRSFQLMMASLAGGFLLVAVPAVWCYNYFSSKVEGFDVEMENSSMELVSYLARRAPRK